MKDISNTQIFDALSMVTWFGMNTKSLMFQSPEIRQQMINLVAMVRDHKTTPPSVAADIAECYEG